MNKETLERLAFDYEQLLRSQGIKKQAFPPDRKIEISVHTLQHARYLIDEVTLCIEKNMIEKASARMIFIQASLWNQGLISIEEILEDQQT